MGILTFISFSAAALGRSFRDKWSLNNIRDLSISETSLLFARVSGFGIFKGYFIDLVIKSALTGNLTRSFLAAAFWISPGTYLYAFRNRYGI